MEHPEYVVKNPASCTGIPGFGSRPRNQLLHLRFLTVPVGSRAKIKIGHEQFSQHPGMFIIHNHPNIHMYRCISRSRQSTSSHNARGTPFVSDISIESEMKDISNDSKWAECVHCYMYSIKQNKQVLRKQTQKMNSLGHFKWRWAFSSRQCIAFVSPHVIEFSIFGT